MHWALMTVLDLFYFLIIMHTHSEGARLRHCSFFGRKKRESPENPVPPAFDASVAACPELHVRRRNVKRPLDNSGVNTVGGENSIISLFFSL